MSSPLGDFLRLRRRELGIDRRTLAERSGLSYPYVSQLENSDEKRPSEKALRLIAPALELTLEDLLAAADGQTSGPVGTSPAPPGRSPEPRTPRRSASLGDEETDHLDLVVEIDRRLRRYPPATRLEVLHELQARALSALAREG